MSEFGTNGGNAIPFSGIEVQLCGLTCNVRSAASGPSNSLVALRPGADYIDQVMVSSPWCCRLSLAVTDLSRWKWTFVSCGRYSFLVI